MNARNLLLIAATMLWLACSNETPTPSATPPPKPPSPTAAAPLATEGLTLSSPADEAVRALSNEPPLDTPLILTPPGAPAATANTTTFGPFVAVLPAGWEATQPSSTMRLAQFKLSAADGNSDAGEVAITYFGSRGAGGKEANLRRWAGQFQGDANEMFERARIEDKKLGAFEVTLFDLSGTFTSPPFAGGGGSKPNSRMLAAIVNTDRGPYYVKAIGPEKTIAANVQAFEMFLASLRIK